MAVDVVDARVRGVDTGIRADAAAGIVRHERIDLAGVRVGFDVFRAIHLRGAEQIGSAPAIDDHVALIVEAVGGRERAVAENEREPFARAVVVEFRNVERAAVEQVHLEALTPLMTIARRFERVSDQAKNICRETIYACTGEDSRHQGEEKFRLLFVDERNATLSAMAETIAKSKKNSEFEFQSAGLNPAPIDARTLSFMKEKGLDVSGLGGRKVPDLERFHIVVTFSKEVTKALPPAPRKTIYLEWETEDPSHLGGAPEQVRAAYERSFESLRSHIDDLVEAILCDVAG